MRRRRRNLPLLLLPLVAVLLAATAAPGDASSDETQVTKLVPPADGRAHFGFTFLLFDSTEPVWGDSRPFDERIRDSIESELAGKTPTFLNVWTPWQHPDLRGDPMVPFGSALADIAKVRSVVGEGGTIYLDWNITQTKPWNGGITTRDIAAGKVDAYLRRYARDVRAYGRPLLVRLFNGEFNGSWWYGVSPKADPRVTTRDFVRAWRRVVDIFRAVGATNVSWAWVPNAYPADATPYGGIDPNIAAYWPGDDYVDWAGADFYDVGTPSWLDSPYAFAVAHHKPFFVGEFGIRHEWSSVPPGRWSEWLGAAFDYFESHPAIKAISYFNLNNRRGATHVFWDPSRDVSVDGGRVRYTPDVNDHDSRLLAGGPAIRALYSRRIASPRYVSAIATEHVDATPQPATVTMATLSVHGRTATAHWHGNLAADTYDLAVRRSTGGWRVVAQHVRRASYRMRGQLRERLRVRVRARDVFGAISPWSPAAAIAFPAR